MNASPDTAKIETFAELTVTRLAAAWTIASIHIGDRLGLYAALAEGVGTVFPPEHAAVLAIDDSPAFLAGAGGVLAAVFQGEPQIVEAFQGDGKLAWGDQAPCLFGAVDRFYRTGYANSLLGDWIPALNGVDATLHRGGRVADIGCGRGTALVMMAEAFPNSTFVGIDNHDHSLSRASERVADAGVGRNVRLERGDSATFAGGPYDLICYFDALHDMGDPDAAIRNARRQIADTGSVMLIEPAAQESVADSVGDVAAQLYYPGSAFLCTPNAISQGTTALGNQVPESTWRDLFTRAGFTNFNRVAETPFNRVFEARP